MIVPTDCQTEARAELAPSLGHAVQQMQAARRTLAAVYAMDADRANLLATLGHLTNAIEMAQQANQGG